jgi:hypothetical protein
VFPAKPPTASHFYRKPKSCFTPWSNFLVFCRCARLLEVWQKMRFRTGLLVLVLNQMWKVELKHPYKNDIIYMIGSWRVLPTFTSHFYMYQSFILSKKLTSKQKLTLRPSPTLWGYPLLSKSSLVPPKGI